MIAFVNLLLAPDCGGKSYLCFYIAIPIGYSNICIHLMALEWIFQRPFWDQIDQMSEHPHKI